MDSLAFLLDKHFPTKGLIDIKIYIHYTDKQK